MLCLFYLNLICKHEFYELFSGFLNQYKKPKIMIVGLYSIDSRLFVLPCLLLPIRSSNREKEEKQTDIKWHVERLSDKITFTFQFLLSTKSVWTEMKKVKNIGQGCRHSSVDSSVPSILPPRVRVPSTPSMLFQLILFKLYICHLNWNVKRTKIYKKRPGLAHF